jgi:hydrogenase/urease accessory protein HupE
MPSRTRDLPARLRRGLAVVLLLAAAPVAAHTLRPAIATFGLHDDGRLTLEIETNLEALVAGVGPQHADTDDAPEARAYDRLRRLAPGDLRDAFDAFAPGFLARVRPEVDGVLLDVGLDGVAIPPVGDTDLARKSVIRLVGSLPRGAATLHWAWPAEYGSCALRLRYGDAPVTQSHWLEEGTSSPAIALDAAFVPRPVVDVARDYLVLGFAHIVPLGLDHILFVLGLFLLSLRLGPILWQVTSFTVAHTITLALTIYGVVSLSPAVVEPLIALSIAYVGLENVLTNRLRPWRVVVVFGFGLLHGMGFAGVLGDIGLPESEFLAALVAFNVGVEFGQLAVIALALLAVGAWRHRPWYRARVVIPASLAITAVGLYWTVERLV